MTHIILGYDGSSSAHAALDWVAARCAVDDGLVTLVEVQSPWSGGSARTVPTALDAAAEELRERAPAIRVVASRMRGVVATELAEAGGGADLLVMGVHRGSSLRTPLGGILPLRVTARARLPVVLVPVAWTSAAGAVTVGVDDDTSSDAAIAFAAGEADRIDRPLRLVHAWLMGTPDLQSGKGVPQAPRLVESIHRALLEAAASPLRQSRARPVETVLVRDNPSAALAAAALDSAMVVIGTHHRGPAAGALLGSVGWDLMGELDRPLVVVPATP